MPYLYRVDKVLIPDLAITGGHLWLLGVRIGKTIKHGATEIGTQCTFDVATADANCGHCTDGAFRSNKNTAAAVQVPFDFAHQINVDMRDKTTALCQFQNQSFENQTKQKRLF